MLQSPCTANYSLEPVSSTAHLHYTPTYLKIHADLIALRVTSPRIRQDHVRRLACLHSSLMIQPIGVCLCVLIALITMDIKKYVEEVVLIQHLLITLQDCV